MSAFSAFARASFVSARSCSSKTARPSARFCALASAACAVCAASCAVASCAACVWACLSASACCSICAHLVCQFCGHPLLLPNDCLEGWTTTLPQHFTPAQIIELYCDHATHEQFHSEFKTDLDLERLPSGKFDTNFLVCALAAVAMNILRLIGQNSLTGKDAPLRHQAKRRRIKTVLQELMFKAARMIKHAGRWVLGLGEHSPKSCNAPPCRMTCACAPNQYTTGALTAPHNSPKARKSRRSGTPSERDGWLNGPSEPPSGCWAINSGWGSRIQVTFYA